MYEKHVCLRIPSFDTETHKLCNRWKHKRVGFSCVMSCTYCILVQ